MVLKHRRYTMTSEQPLKKKLRRGDETEHLDETDFINNLTENGVRTDLQALHLSLPANVNEDDITRNAVNLQFYEEKSNFRTSECESKQSEKIIDDEMNCKDLTSEPETIINNLPYISSSENFSMKPAPDIIAASHSYVVGSVVNSPHINLDINSTPPICVNRSNSHVKGPTNHDRHLPDEQFLGTNIDDQDSGLDDFQNDLIRQCICGISEATLRRPFEGQLINDSTGIRTAMLSEWSIKKVLQFLSNLQLLFDVYLKQNNKGFICSRIVTICDMIICNENNLIEQIISLCDTRNKFVNFLAARVLSSFFIIAKTNINTEWLETILNFLSTENTDYSKMNFALEVVKRVVEWKDIEIHVLEDAETSDTAGTSSREVDINVNCVTVPFSDSESFDTSAIKGLIIKSLESKWPELIHRVHDLIQRNILIEVKTYILTFLALWESIISVKANLSVIDTKPFYAGLERFVTMLNNNLSPLIWKQLLSLFNEVLCYGSTLALQDALPDDTCQLAHCVINCVKDNRLLDRLPYRREEGLMVNSFVGTIVGTQHDESNIDKTLLQKMVLLVLKSVAITIKEARSDSSDSSVGSDDSDFYHDMQVIGRSIRDVLKKLDIFIKNSLDFHPETPFSRVLIHLFNEQDDYMIESMVCTLDITVGISYRNAVFPDLINMLNPTHSFIEFLKIVAHDSGVLLDFLVSNETSFLLYLLRFLKYIKRNWLKFVSSCGEGSASRSNELDSTMAVLINLNIKINRLVSRSLFPYNITPVVRLLDVCENLYEGNDLS